MEEILNPGIIRSLSGRQPPLNPGNQSSLNSFSFSLFFLSSLCAIPYITHLLLRMKTKQSKRKHVFSQQAGGAYHRLTSALERFPPGIVEVHDWFPNQLLSITHKVYAMSSAVLQVFPRPRDTQLCSSLCRLLKGHLLLTEADKKPQRGLREL